MKLKQGLIVSAVAACALLVGVLPATAQTTTRCTGEVSGTIRANVTVPAGEICTVEDATITGNVTVGRGADIYVSSSTVNGNVVAQRDAYVDVFDTAVNGSVRLNASFGLYMELSGAASTLTGNFMNNAADDGFVYLYDSDARSNVRISGGEAFIGDDPVGDTTPGPDEEGRGSRITGDMITTDTLYTDIFNTVLYSDLSVSGSEQGSLLCTSEIDGHTSIAGNSEVVQVGADAPFEGCGFNVMSGDVDILDNTGDIQVAGNAIRGNLNCEGNDPAPMIGANRLRGVGTGQCDPANEIAAAQPMAMARINSDSSAPANADRHAALETKILERRAAAGQSEPTVEEKEEAAETQVETRAAEAEAAPAAPPARVEGRALPPRSRG